MTLARHHRLPFGAEVDAAGRGVRFRLWAPAAAHVDVCLEGDGAEPIPMRRETGGWHVIETGAAGPGTRYRYRIDGDRLVPDPASRFQPDDVHGPSEVIDARAWPWQDAEWRGRPWEETVLYELHVGAFTARGDFEGVRERLGYLADLGVTAIELMPIGDFPGARNWGYDGVLPFAPDSRYGTPDELKALVESAHASGLMVFLDVVYNHFGPEGNYLHAYAPRFFTDRHRTPWGEAIDFDGPHRAPVREFFINNALYWLEEYHVDGLRLDAVHAIADDCDPDILVELAARVRKGPGARRFVHLVLENDDNAARYLERDRALRARRYTAQWNDDLHHALHVLATGERDGYYADYADAPARHLGRCLAEGFAYQGERSAHRGGRARGEPSAHLPATAFVGFLQNHDQIGNRALGERIGALAGKRAVRAAHAVVLLAPSIPLLFMGEELDAPEPFLFFCDFEPELAAAVRRGRRAEFARFAAFADSAARRGIPDPGDPGTFARCVLDWDRPSAPGHRETHALVRELLALRARVIVPRLAGLPGGGARWEVLGAAAVRVAWTLGDGSTLAVLANLSENATAPAARPDGESIFALGDMRAHGSSDVVLDAWSVGWFLDSEPRQ
ncbi:MAG: malto-oligosyltrehalose trehalohydrolase [Gammaproteobacteria bacterium]|nr:malto-oligosyltrehalose trehalohydrolase [Gammaproteobacteria bacterium]